MGNIVVVSIFNSEDKLLTFVREAQIIVLRILWLILGHISREIFL